MSAFSIESAIRTCKVDTGYANKVESDRFLNPDNMMCPIWNGVDTQGREVCADSFYTKSAGCNSAEDRVQVENDVSRPQYIEYVPLSAGGIRGEIYDNTMQGAESVWRLNELDRINTITGNFGKQFGANIYPRCNTYPDREAYAQEKQSERQNQAMRVGSGMGNKRCGY
jgi:hypothetical protein